MSPVKKKAAKKAAKKVAPTVSPPDETDNIIGPVTLAAVLQNSPSLRAKEIEVGAVTGEPETGYRITARYRGNKFAVAVGAPPSGVWKYPAVVTEAERVLEQEAAWESR